MKHTTSKRPAAPKTTKATKAPAPRCELCGRACRTAAAVASYRQHGLCDGCLTGSTGTNRRTA